MVFKQPQFGTSMEQPKAPEQPELTDKERCELGGGYWDEKRQKCLKVAPKPEEPEPVDTKPRAGEVIYDAETGEPKGFINSSGNYVAASREDIQNVISKQQAKTAPIVGGVDFEARKQQELQAAQGRQLAGGVGQFGELGVDPTRLNYGEAVTTAAVGSIPSALSLASQAGIGAAVLGGAALGAKAGVIGAPATGGLSVPVATALGAAAGLLVGLTRGMLSNFKSQRTDTTTSQQRVLDEGKQTLMDWVTLSRADPTNRAYYLSQYNMQAALINQAYRQMKLDTSRDVTKFETALPNLAEFETFYSTGGERDALDLEMRNALLTVSPENYNMLELAFRRGENNDKNK